MLSILQKAIGWNDTLLTAFLCMMIRGLVIYLLGVVIARFDKKLIGMRNPFNLILFVMLGSIFASAITDPNLFLPIIGTFLFLVFLNALTTLLAFNFPAIEKFIKGASVVLIKNGEIQRKAMRANFITENELYSEIQTQLHANDLKNITTALLESDGSINFIVKK